jgi:sodium transport system permease protein
MWSQTVAVLRKELREVVRDRRSLASGLFYGVWGPLVMALALTALARDRNNDAPLTLPVGGSERAPSLLAFLAARGVSVAAAPDNAADLVRSRKLPIALLVPETYPASFNGARPAKVIVLYESSWSESRSKADRIKALLGEYARSVGDTRLVLRGVSPSAASPLDIAERDLSTAASRAATVLALLPIFVLLAAFVGGMSVAADLTAGERERGSLESLLLNPAPRLTIVVGKWMATSAVSLATVALTLAVSHFLLALPRIQAIDLPVGLSVSDAMRMALVLAPLAVFASALQLLMALFARTYKEAQAQLSLLMLVPMLPGFLFAFGSLQPRGWMMWVPMLGQHIAMTDIVRGQILSPGIVGAMTVCTVLGAALALGLTARLLNREGIVRRLGA